jgi:hypothetical protein
VTAKVYGREIEHLTSFGLTYAKGIREERDLL